MSGPGAIAALSLLFALSYLAARATYLLPIFEDLAEIRPYRRMVFEAFSSGRFPLWSPSLLAGLPLAGFAHSSAFYPLGFIFGVWEFNTASVINLYVHLAIFGWGMYLLMRSLAIERAAAAVAAVMITFGPMNTYWQLCFLPTIYTAAWAPWLFASAFLILSRPRPIYLLGMALAFALQVTGGRYDLITRELILLLGTGLAAGALRREWIKGVGLWLAAGLIGALAAAVIPMHYEYFHRSIRSPGLGFDYFASFQGDHQTLLLALVWFSFPSVMAALCGLGYSSRRGLIAGAAAAGFASILWIWAPRWWLFVNYLTPVVRNQVWSNVMVVFLFISLGVLAGEGIGALSRRTAAAGAVRIMVLAALVASAVVLGAGMLIGMPEAAQSDAALSTHFLARGRMISAAGLMIWAAAAVVWVRGPGRRGLEAHPTSAVLVLFALMAGLDVVATAWAGAARRERFQFPPTPPAVPGNRAGYQPYRSIHLYRFGDWQGLGIPVQAGSEPGTRSFDGFISMPPRRLGEFLALLSPEAMTIAGGKLQVERFMSVFKEDAFIDGRALQLMSFLNTGWFVAGKTNIKYGPRYHFRWAAEPGLGFAGDFRGAPSGTVWEQHGPGGFFDTVTIMPGTRFRAEVAVAGDRAAWLQLAAKVAAGGGGRLFYSRAWPGNSGQAGLEAALPVRTAVSAVVRIAGFPVGGQSGLNISWRDPVLANNTQPLKFVAEDDDSAVYWNPAALRLLFPAHEVKVIPDEGERLEYLGEHPDRLAGEAVLEREAPGPVAKADLRKERVVALEYQDQRLVFEAELIRPGVVVMSETYYPGWRAVSEAGHELPILRADHAFRAVWLPDGRHRVTMTFQPAAFRIGLWVSLATMAAAAGWAVRKTVNKIGGW